LHQHASFVIAMFGQDVAGF